MTAIHDEQHSDTTDASAEPDDAAGTTGVRATDLPPTEGGRTPVPFRSLLAIAALVIAVVLVPLIAHHRDTTADPATVCKTGLYVRSIKGQDVVAQDQGAPGPDACDLPRHGGVGALATLGTDCRIRDAEGTVTGTVKPDRPDGTCGAGAG